MLERDIEKTFYSEEQIQERVKALGAVISKDYEDKNPLVVGVLKGAVPFLSDLVRSMNINMEMDFMDVSSYGNATVSSGEVRILKDLSTVVEGRHILIVEDIIDSGRTLKYLVELLKHRKAASVKIVTMLDKPEGRVVEMDADYIGFEVPNEFVFGYGLDYAEDYRNMPYIGILKPEIYENN